MVRLLHASHEGAYAALQSKMLQTRHYMYREADNKAAVDSQLPAQRELVDGTQC